MPEARDTSTFPWVSKDIRAFQVLPSVSGTMRVSGIEVEGNVLTISVRSGLRICSTLREASEISWALVATMRLSPSSSVTLRRILSQKSNWWWDWNITVIFVL